MKQLLSIALLLLVAMNPVFAGGEKDFDFYKSIPRYESITLSGQEIKITIKSDYTVTLSASNSDSEYEDDYSGRISSSLSGNGQVLWDVNTKSMYLQLSGTVRGSYEGSRRIYEYKKKYNFGSITANLLGVDTDLTYNKKEYVRTDYYNADGSEKFSVRTTLSIDNDLKYYSIENKTVSATLRGNITKSVYFKFISGQKFISYGPILATSQSVNDEFGAWQWTSDKSDIYLYSTNIRTDKLELVRDTTSNFKLRLSYNGKEIEGTSSTSTPLGKMIHLTLSFEDGQNVTLTFLETKPDGHPIYTYATYNRFLEEWNYDATSIINQLKDKQSVVVTYIEGGSNYSSFFELEGLETILLNLK